jgi:probable lipoprotein NlpC
MGDGFPLHPCRVCVWFVLGILLWLGGCAAAPDPAAEAILPAAAPPNPETELVSEIRTWLGTPHRMGGLTHGGIDCSGLVMVVYAHVYDIRLPRTAVAQMHTGRRVDPPALAPGDLVFFKPAYKGHHVGIYLGEGRFVHTSSSRGVVVSRLDDAFWRECYLTGRRLLPVLQ